MLPLDVRTLLVVLVLLASPGNTRAQNSPAWELVLSESIAAIISGAPGEALDPLEGIFEAAPGAFSRENLSVAYWLGQAYLLEGYPDDAREVWGIGLRALEEAGHFDPRLAVTFIHAAYETPWPGEQPVASAAYLLFLEQLVYPIPEDVRQQAVPFLEGLLIVLSPAQRRAWQLPEPTEADALSLTPAQASRIVAWWRSQDPAPATRANELLVEHLSRIAYARRHYRAGDAFDDRGALYIRLGAPSNVTSIQFDKTGFRNKVLDRSLTLHESDFPENEFWYYEHIDPAAQYLFHDASGKFRSGEVRHLLPTALRSGLGLSERGQEKARAVARTLEEIYRQLSLYHPDYTTRYQDVAAFVSLLDEGEVAAEAEDRFNSDENAVDAEGSDEVRRLMASRQNSDNGNVGLPGSSFNPNRPDLFVQSMLANDKASDEMMAANREEYVPMLRTNTFDEIAPLPLYVRSARFLDADGTTRTEVYWAAPSGALALDKTDLERLAAEGFEPMDYLLLTSTVQKTPAYLDRVVNLQRTLLRDVGTGEEATVSAQTVAVSGDTGLFHVAMEWDQFAASLNEQGTLQTTGPLLKTHVFRLDSLRALNADPASLEVSDLRPLLLPPGVDPEDAAARIGDLEGLLYPSPFIQSEKPLLLYFEVYHLAYDRDDRTHYTIEYEIERRTGKRARTGDRTSFRTSQQGEDRLVHQRLLLDLSDMGGAGEIDIRLQVTDDVTGRQVSRTISFEID